jgi:hypothetical protein
MSHRHSYDVRYRWFADIVLASLARVRSAARWHPARLPAERARHAKLMDEISTFLAGAQVMLACLIQIIRYAP